MVLWTDWVQLGGYYLGFSFLLLFVSHLDEWVSLWQIHTYIEHASIIFTWNFLKSTVGCSWNQKCLGLQWDVQESSLKQWQFVAVVDWRAGNILSFSVRLGLLPALFPEGSAAERNFQKIQIEDNILLMSWPQKTQNLMSLYCICWTNHYDQLRFKEGGIITHFSIGRKSASSHLKKY